MLQYAACLTLPVCVTALEPMARKVALLVIARIRVTNSLR
jgi:hypothetical protein